MHLGFLGKNDFSDEIINMNIKLKRKKRGRGQRGEEEGIGEEEIYYLQIK